jgi:hypothetical protein
MKSTEQPQPAAAPGSARAKRRLYIGVGVFAMAWVLSLAAVPLVTLSGLPTSAKATLTGLLVLGGPKIGLLIAIAIMGKPGFAYLMMLASLFVLGGDFWDKLRALFIREAKVQFPASAS